MRGAVIVIAVVAILLISATLFADGEENLSAGRGFGFGMEAGVPWGGLVSARYWFTPQLGVEGIVFAWGELPDLTGVFTGRLLYKLSDTEAVDFYITGGGTVPFSPYGENELILSTAGGIEFSFPFAPNLAFNLEFGGAFSTVGRLMMAFGTGIHFYC
ncbi:hypothetical protein DRJ23_06250 [Candidatus Acetothermia bacterium]|nr:MAG: hypothetical protein DRJ23_06250 [Candidatus Acetothermia bacterium]